MEKQGETFQDEDLESLENDPNDTTSWTIGHERVKKENTQNKSSHETVVQDDFWTFVMFSIFEYVL